MRGLAEHGKEQTTSFRTSFTLVRTACSAVFDVLYVSTEREDATALHKTDQFCVLPTMALDTLFSFLPSRERRNSSSSASDRSSESEGSLKVSGLFVARCVPVKSKSTNIQLGADNFYEPQTAGPSRRSRDLPLCALPDTPREL